MGFILRITLLVFWLFAITAPSIIILCDNQKTIIVTNLNEEEHQASVKKTMGEEKFVKENLLDFSLIPLAKKLLVNNFLILGKFNLSFEVLSPPPEHLT